jgi:hypothetical protein
MGSPIFKRGMVLGAVLVAVSLVFLAIASAQPYPPAFYDDNFEKHQRPPAKFDHDYHMDYPGVVDCYTCHHYYEDGELIPEMSSDDMRCVDCHPVEAQKPGQTNLNDAYHLMCKSCHDRLEMGPITCGECHVRGLEAE